VALKRKGVASPANSKTRPPIKGPGTRAMLAIDCVTPNVPPCSFAEVLFEIKLGTAVFIVPIPDAISVIETKKMATFWIRGIR